MTVQDTDTETEVDKDKEGEPTRAAAADEPPDEAGQAPQRVSMPGTVCMAMKAVGMVCVNPSHPDLQALIDKGADIGLFVGAARAALDKQKGFAYALGMVKGQLRDAAALADTAVAAPRPLAHGYPFTPSQARDERRKATMDGLTGRDKKKAHDDAIDAPSRVL